MLNDFIINSFVTMRCKTYHAMLFITKLYSHKPINSRALAWHSNGASCSHYLFAHYTSVNAVVVEAPNCTLNNQVQLNVALPHWIKTEKCVSSKYHRDTLYTFLFLQPKKRFSRVVWNQNGTSNFKNWKMCKVGLDAVVKNKSKDQGKRPVSVFI